MARIKKSKQHADCQQILDGSATDAARILTELMKGKRKSLSGGRQRACEFVIEHSIGKATQKAIIKHTGSPLTYKELADDAEKIIAKAKAEGKAIPDVLEQAEAVAANAAETSQDRQEPGPGAESDELPPG